MRCKDDRVVESEMFIQTSVSGVLVTQKTGRVYAEEEVNNIKTPTTALRQFSGHRRIARCGNRAGWHKGTLKEDQEMRRVCSL